MNLVDPECQAQQFVDEWNNGEPHVFAHTSGSTGKPKEIKLLKSDMLVSARSTCDFFNLTSDSTLVCPLSTDYIAGKMMIVRAIVANCKLIIEPPSNRPLRTTNDVKSIDLLPIVPSQAEWLIANRCQLPKIKHIIVGGAPMSNENELGLKSLADNVWATYGMTETCSHVALRRAGDDTFQALPHITFTTTDDNRLIIKSERMSWRELTTTDVVQLVTPTEFRWLGRSDNVINSGGVKLHPEIIEAELAPFIAKPFYVRGIADSKLGTALQLVIEDPDGTVDSDSLLRQLKLIDSIHPYHIPRWVITTRSLPRTSNGKIRRN